MKHHPQLRAGRVPLRRSTSLADPSQKRRFPQDKFFHLPTAIALNDPFLRQVYGVVSQILDDHPYPTTRDEFRRRTREINRNIRELYLHTTQLNFLQRLMVETGINVVRPRSLADVDALLLSRLVKVDLWQGSHVIVLDNGILYETWSQSPLALPRFSSHYRQVPVQQYGINFRDHQLLFGKTAADGLTWFQMEAHAFDPSDFYSDPDLIVYHGQDFLKYRVHGMNVGPFGFSPHTETMNPVVLPYKPWRPKTDPRQKGTRFSK